MAINNNIGTVCIDETAGIRIAKLNDLKVTGSLGVIISAIKSGENFDIESVVENMIKNGFWISQELTEDAIRLVGNKWYQKKLSALKSYNVSKTGKKNWAD